jgi:hypothetical protein
MPVRFARSFPNLLSAPPLIGMSMNVFEDLIVELKEENLLEKTVIEASKEDNPTDPETHSPEPEFPVEVADDTDPMVAVDDHPPHDPGYEGADGEVQEADHAEASAPDTSDQQSETKLIPDKPTNGREFYKKRAIGEISNLQMVEHVLTGIERQYLKIIPKTFDDFQAKKCLNAFLQVTDDENSVEHAESEFAMLQETESWCTALEERDKQVPVSALRQYCENSRPALSSQAMVALARFYRNLPYSESVRAKFDFIMTRLFSRPALDHKRFCLFTREEMLNHINLLYREWSSIPLYLADEDESKVLLTALSFEELAQEAESVTDFDLLIAGDFFGRLRMFKESVSELFFAPDVTAAAVECNIRIGNAYVKLLDLAREKMDEQSISNLLESLDSQNVSDATATTFDIVSILRTRHQESETDEAGPENPSDPQRDASGTFDYSELLAETAETQRIGIPGFIDRLKGNVRSVSRSLVVVTVVLIAASIGIYVWANIIVSESMPSPAVVSVDLDQTILKVHIKTGKISGHNFYGLMQPSWDALPREQREEYLQSVYQYVQEKGCTQVTLINAKGQTIGFASASKLDVVMP